MSEPRPHVWLNYWLPGFIAGVGVGLVAAIVGLFR